MSRKHTHRRRIDPRAGAERIMRLMTEGDMLARARGDQPAVPAARRQVMATLHSAMDSMTAGREPTPRDWSALADVVQMVDCMIRRGNIPESEGVPIAVAGMQAMVKAADRQQAGRQLRFDGEGIQAMRAVLDVFEQTLEALPEREVLQIMMQTQRMRERAFGDIEAGRVPS